MDNNKFSNSNENDDIKNDDDKNDSNDGASITDEEDNSSELEFQDQKSNELKNSRIDMKTQSVLSQMTSLSEETFNQDTQIISNIDLSRLKKITNKKSLNSINNYYIKTFKNQKSKNLYPIRTENFIMAEKLLFDLVGFSAPQFKEDEMANQTVDAKKINSLVNGDCDSMMIGDMNALSGRFEINEYNQLFSYESSLIFNDEKSSKEFSTNETNAKSNKKNTKLITIVLNQSVRPRKAGRFILNRKSIFHMDSILSEISVLFKMDSTFVKKLFNLNGVQIENPRQLFEMDEIFFASSTDKFLHKDLELDAEEVKLILSNKFMKKNFNLNLVRPKMSEKAAVDKDADKKKNDKDKLTTSHESDLENIPEEVLEYYEIGPIIGEGHYSVVRECKDINTGIVFALKIVDLKKCVGKEDMVKNEIQILTRIRHPNIIKIVEEFRSDDHFYLIMENLKGGDLLEDLTSCKKYNEPVARRLIYNLASAIAYLHSVNVAHRDIKLENILIQKYSDGNMSLKLGDFGLATFLENTTNQKCGSPIYVAPEILEGKNYGKEVDIWSLGVIMYILLCGFAPFQGSNDEETFNAIKNDQLQFISPHWDEITSDAKELIAKMLDRNSETRIKASDILTDKWFIISTKQLESKSINSISKISDIKSLNKSLVDSEPERKPVRSSKFKIDRNTKKNYKATNVLLNEPVS